MGRTFRKRAKKRTRHIRVQNLDQDPYSINLRKWLVRNNWTNELSLQLRSFPETGRGVCSPKNTKENDILIRIPYELLITFKTLEIGNYLNLLNLEKRFKMIDLLTLFLVIEKQNGEKSKYKHYLESLPCPEPTLPWFCSASELNLYPLDLKIKCERALGDYQESFLRVSSSISTSVRVTEDLYRWAYVLVNTRAVYIDPRVCCQSKTIDFLLDEPSMALCPYLDMFNHHYLARTDAEIMSINGRPFYQLRTYNKTQKYDQIFICYGAHDNEKLLREYGFFVPGNLHDCVRFELNEVQEMLGLFLEARQYKFLQEHKFTTREKLYVSSSGLSFGLKAMLFVAFSNSSLRDYNAVIYGGNYPEEFCVKLRKCVEIILRRKLETFEMDYNKLENSEVELSESSKLVLNFLDYRKQFVEKLILAGVSI